MPKTPAAESDTDLVSTVYAERVRPLRTRSYKLDVPPRENAVEILHTLLGIELKVGRRRFACPDLATARYLSVFARIGCGEFAIPYDITKISTIADELETAFHRELLSVEANSNRIEEKQARRRRSSRIRFIRDNLKAIGPGDKMPVFKQSTKQRSS